MNLAYSTMAKKGVRMFGACLLLVGLLMVGIHASSITGFGILDTIDGAVGSFMSFVIVIAGVLFIWVGNRGEETQTVPKQQTPVNNQE